MALADVNLDAAKSAARAIGNNAVAVHCDVTRKADIAAAVEETLSAFGGLDILVNNAGATHVNKPMLDIDEAEYDRIFAVNVKGIFLFCQAVVPQFRKQKSGTIINIGSTAGLRPRPGLSAYNATKGAVHMLTKSLAVELAPDRIRVCAIAPVATETPLLPSFLGPAEGQREKFIATVPLGRLAQPQDIANAALFLASADAAIRHRQYRRGRRRQDDLSRAISSACPSAAPSTFSMVRKITLSTNRPMRMTVRRPANTEAVSSSLRFSKMNQPSPPGTRARPEHKLGGDQRAPGKSPADLQAGEDRGKRRRHQQANDVGQAGEPAVLSRHAQRRADGQKSRMGVERDRPQHRMHDDEDEAHGAEPEPQQRERQAAQWPAAD